MQYIIYLLSVLIAVMSFMVVFYIVKEKKKYINYLLPIYMDMVIIIALYTKQLSSFGLLGILAIIPLVKLFVKKQEV